MKNIWMAVGLVVATAAAPGSAATGGEEVLIPSYYRYLLATQVSAQGAKLAAEAPAGVTNAVLSAVEQWAGQRMSVVRAELEKQFGEQARGRFEAFVTAYSEAERQNDTAYLGQLAQRAGGLNTEGGFPAFRQAALQRWLSTEVEAGASLLGNLQTWIELAARGGELPPLDVWLARDQKGAPPAVPKTAPPKPVNPLADAEAPSVAVEDEAGAAPAGMLDAFAGLRKTRREQALQEAQAGMQQVAAERQAAEQEYAARKAAAAQAEAEALKAQAQKLAAVEQEALEQRKNSWTGKLKAIVSTTVGAAVGAFTGGIGTQAGQRAAAEIFK